MKYILHSEESEDLEKTEYMKPFVSVKRNIKKWQRLVGRMAKEVGKKRDRWWIVDLLLEAGDLLLFIPRGIFRILKEMI